MPPVAANPTTGCSLSRYGTRTRVAALHPLSLDALELRRQMDDTDSKGGSLSFAKTLRLVRLAKMLRVARLKRIVGRHASLVEFSAYVRGRLPSLDLVALARGVLANQR